MNLRRALQHKLGTERGASLSMALMLLLVCTVVASVALTAATAASGRMSQLKEKDRTYYNVTSAARLFWDEMEGGNVVTVARACDAVLGGDGMFDAATASHWAVTIDDAVALDEGNTVFNPSSVGLTLFQVAACDYLFPSTAATTLTFDQTRSVAQTQVLQTVDFDDLELVDPTVGNATYEPFDLVSDDARIKTVSVRVTRTGSGTFDFTFSEKGNASSSVCTLTATVGIDNGTPSVTQVDGNLYHLAWNSVVSWTPESIRMGGESA